MISLLLALFLPQSTLAVSADPFFGLSPAERTKYQTMALRSTVALMPADGSRLCSGNLISRRHVLTSAHCFDKIDGHRPAMQVHFVNAKGQLSQILPVRAVAIHPLWFTEGQRIEEWNAPILVLRAQLAEWTSRAPPDCKLAETQWDEINLNTLLKLLDDPSVRAEVPRLCSNVVQGIHKLLRRERKLLARRLIDVKLPRAGDLAVLTLDQEIKDGFHEPIDIDDHFVPAADESRLAFVAGFGFSKPAQQFDGQILPFQLGFARIHGLNDQGLMTVSVSASICSGDSGGPTTYVKHDKMNLIGVNTGSIVYEGGQACDFKTSAGEALNLGEYSTWIRAEMAN